MNLLLDPQTITELVNENYSLGEVQICNFIRRGFNDHYLVKAGGERYIFRVYLNHKYYIESPDAFQFELELLEHLHTQDIPVARALPLKDGELLGWTGTELGKRAFALFVYAEGAEIDRGDLTKEESFAFGKTIAAFHLAANTFQTELERYRLDLKYLVDEPLRRIAEQKDNTTSKFYAEHSEMIQETVASWPIEKLVSAVESLSVNSDEFGIIHSDLHLGNAHFQESKITLFDFDHCAYGWRAYDLATAFYLPESQREALFEGYESLRPLSQDEKECLPIFADLRHLWNIGDILAAERVTAEPKP